MDRDEYLLFAIGLLVKNIKVPLCPLYLIYFKDFSRLSQ